MNRFIRPAALALAVLFIVESASAQTVGIGTRKRGATVQMAASIAKVVSSNAGFQMRTQPMAGTQQYIAQIHSGNLEFGVVNAMQFHMSSTGTGIAKAKFENIRVAAVLVNFHSGIMVRDKSDIKTTADLKGKRLPTGFRSAPVFQLYMDSFLDHGGLSWDQVSKVPAVGLRQSFQIFAQGKIDAVPAAAASPFNHEMQAKIPGGIRILSLDGTPEQMRAMLAHLPKTYTEVLHPSEKLAGVTGPTTMLAYDYTLTVGKDVPNETVYQTVKVIHDHAGDLRDSHPVWRSFKAEIMSKDLGMPVHPGAARFYKEKKMM